MKNDEVEKKKENKKEKMVKRQISILTIFLWIFLVATMITITISEIRNKNAIEEKKYVNISVEMFFTGVDGIDSSVMDFYGGVSELFGTDEYWRYVFDDGITVSYTINLEEINFYKTEIIYFSDWFSAGCNEDGEQFYGFTYPLELPIEVFNREWDRSKQAYIEIKINDFKFKGDFEKYILVENNNGKEPITIRSDFPDNLNNNLVYHKTTLTLYEDRDKEMSGKPPRPLELYNVKLTSICKNDLNHNIQPEYFNLAESTSEYLSSEYCELSTVRKEGDKYLCDLTVKAENWMPKINKYISENKNSDIEHIYDSCDNVVTFTYDEDTDTWIPDKEEVIINVKEEVVEEENITVTWLNGYIDTPIKIENIVKGNEDTIWNLYPNNPIREGYEFTNWGDWIIDEEGNIRIIAEWKKSSKYVISYKWEGLPEGNNIVIPVDNNSYNGNDKLKIDTSYKKGTVVKINEIEYKFSGWRSEDVEILDSEEIIMPEKDVVLKGKWEKIKQKTDVVINGNLPNTSDINIYVYISIFIVSIVLISLLVISKFKNNKK